MINLPRAVPPTILYFSFLAWSAVAADEPMTMVDDAQAAANINEVITAFQEADLFSGAILVAHGNRILVNRAHGLANRDWCRGPAKFRGKCVLGRGQNPTHTFGGPLQHPASWTHERAAW
jgi:hypothetical protein